MRILRPIAVLLAPLLLVAACGPAASPLPLGSSATLPPAAHAPGPTDVPGGGLPTDPATLLAAGAAADGKRAVVRKGQPGVAPVTWGVILATGVFHAAAGEGRPALVVEAVTRPETVVPAPAGPGSPCALPS